MHCSHLLINDFRHPNRHFIYEGIRLLYLAPRCPRNPRGYRQLVNGIRDEMQFIPKPTHDPVPTLPSLLICLHSEIRVDIPAAIIAIETPINLLLMPHQFAQESGACRWQMNKAGPVSGLCVPPLSLTSCPKRKGGFGPVHHQHGPHSRQNSICIPRLANKPSANA